MKPEMDEQIEPNLSSTFFGNWTSIATDFPF